MTRFAPSPTGRLHLGHAASALQVWALAEKLGAEVLLRIEDIDQTRCRPEYEAGIYEDLAWLGFAWHEPVRRQSDHFADYASALQQLIDRGLCYRCFRTRRQLQADIARAPHEAPVAATPGPHPAVEEAERLACGEAFAWRLSLERSRDALGEGYGRLGFETLSGGGHQWIAACPDKHGDIVLARKDTPTAYHLAATHDDALQGVTHIVRGKDLETATHIHVLLQALLGWPTPVYVHHDLLLRPDGKRYAKRDAAQTIAALRERGMSADDVLGLAGLG